MHLIMFLIGMLSMFGLGYSWMNIRVINHNKTLIEKMRDKTDRIRQLGKERHERELTADEQLEVLSLESEWQELSRVVDGLLELSRPWFIKRD